ncbi:MAG: hypothetical protein ACR2NB_05750 [Solirubrobacteraceae bacterium]
MPSTLSPPVGGRVDPARARGKRRSRSQASCPPVAVVAIPRKVTAAEVLALVTRTRAAAIAAGELHESRLFDLRVYKTVAAELAYYRRLAFARAPSAHIATSMPQLVRGLARLHPRWDMTGDAFEVRDRHHSAVRRRLSVMVACGLLTWQAGVNDGGEEARTELLLLEAPPITLVELKAARAQLARWRRQYGNTLDTGSTTGICDVTRVAAEPSKAERCMRARNRVQQARAARIRASSPGGKTAPPFGPWLAFGSPQNSQPPLGFAEQTAESSAATPTELPPPKAAATAIPTDADPATDACGDKTGARRARASSFDFSPGAVEGTRNSRIKGAGSVAIGDLGGLADDLRPPGPLTGAELGETVARRVAARLADPVFMQKLADEQARVDELAAAISASAQRRADAVAAGPLERAWTAKQAREAWVVARFGASAIAGGAVFAFHISDQRMTRLRRVLQRYERHAPERPEGWPAGGWAAFLHAAARPDWAHRSPAGTIEGLDQLTKRMRARASADSLQRQAAARRRAEGRRLAADTGPLIFRALPDPGGRWPAWVQVDADGHPIIQREPTAAASGLPDALAHPPAAGFLDAHLLVDEDHPMLPEPGDEHRRLVERDAFLLAGLPLPPHLDGRSLMRDRHTGHAEPSGYDPRADRVDREVLELARLEKLQVAQILKLTPETRHDMLTAARARQQRRLQQERTRFLNRLDPKQRP